ncbi:hypothetical protein [Pseudomonas nicosulfuronedens]
MPDELKKRYRLSFVRGGETVEFEAADEAMSEARAWVHVAHFLKIPSNDVQGFQKPYPSIRRSVEGHNVSAVSFEPLD